jgi:hypothetical protein
VEGETSMAPVVCAVRAPMSHGLVQSAVLFCLGRGADLRLVGIVEDKLSDSTRATGGERVRRYKHTRQELVRAVETARAAGVVATRTSVPCRLQIRSDGDRPHHAGARGLRARLSRVRPAGVG